MTTPMPAVTHVVGNRPHYMKLAPIVRALEARGVQNIILNTGQHWDANMSSDFQREFGLTMTETFSVEPGGHGVQTASMMVALEQYWLGQEALPQFVLVYGDTNSTLAAALVAAKLDIPVGHIEGGVRAEFLDSFMPEEINRKLVDDLSKWVYVPTERCAEELRREGFEEARIINCGDVMFDTLLHTLNQPNRKPVSRARPFVLATVHRAENTASPDRLFAILDALRNLSENYDVVLALHPRTQKTLEETGRLPEYSDTIEFIPPISHTQLLSLMHASAFVVSDSGGVPKEAAFMGKRSVILRRQATWSELVDENYAVIADPLAEDSVGKAVADVAAAPHMQGPIPGFGGGNAADAIAEHILSQLASL